MFQLTGKNQLRYFAPLDSFIKVRKVDSSAIRSLVSGIEFKTRRSYVQFVINTLVVDFNDKVLPDMLSGTPHRNLETAEEELFALCTEVNPELALDKVSTLMASPDVSPLLLLETKAPPPQTMPVSRERLLELEENLKARVVGQDHAVELIADAIRKAYVGFRDEEKPVGNFLFVGPTGVGKTLLAKELAECLFADHTRRLFRVDCSEYSQPHEYAKLIGSPPGFIGHDEGGRLTGALREQPHLVILFDEIEKADAKLHNLLLQILDDGILTDSKGDTVSFRNAVIILTSNVGTRDLEKLSKGFGFTADEKADDRDRERVSHRAVESFFPPEFLNRIDDIILFHGFTREASLRVVRIMLDDVERRLAARGIRIRFGEDVAELLVDRGISHKYGARPLRRVIKKQVESPLARFVLDQEIADGTIEAGVEGDRLTFH